MRGIDPPGQRGGRQTRRSDEVPVGHPLRPVREVVDEILRETSEELSYGYSSLGRPSVPPEKILRALVLQVLYGLSSERLLIAQVAENPLFRWFVGLSPRDRVWHPTTLTKNRARLREHQLAFRFLNRVLDEAQARDLLSTRHFHVDRRPIAAWGESATWHASPAPSVAPSSPELAPGDWSQAAPVAATVRMKSSGD